MPSTRNSAPLSFTPFLASCNLGRNRVLFEIEKETIIVYKGRHRREAHR